jgi:hypothetical protein
MQKAFATGHVYTLRVPQPRPPQHPRPGATPRLQCAAAAAGAACS